MLALPEKLTLAEARQAAEQLAAAVPAAGEAGVLTVDASGLQAFDSTALAVLLECRRAALRQGWGFAMHAAPANLAQLAVLFGVNGLLGLAEPEEAVALQPAGVA